MTTKRKPQRIPQQGAMPVYLSIEEAAEVLFMAPLTIRRLTRIRPEGLESAMRSIPSVDR